MCVFSPVFVCVSVSEATLGIIAIVAIAHIQTVRGGGHREAQNSIIELGHLVLLHLLGLALDLLEVVRRRIYGRGRLAHVVDVGVLLAHQVLVFGASL